MVKRATSAHKSLVHVFAAYSCLFVSCFLADASLSTCLCVTGSRISARAIQSHCNSPSLEREVLIRVCWLASFALRRASACHRK